MICRLDVSVQIDTPQQRIDIDNFTVMVKTWFPGLFRYGDMNPNLELKSTINHQRVKNPGALDPQNPQPKMFHHNHRNIHDNLMYFFLVTTVVISDNDGCLLFFMCCGDAHCFDQGIGY